MTTALPEAQQTAGWRYRDLNGVHIYAIDHTADSLAAAQQQQQQSTTGDALLALIEDFVDKVPIETAVHRWRHNNAYANRQMRVLLVSSERLGAALVHLPEQRSVRRCSLAPPRLLLAAQLSAQPPTDVSFNVVVLRTRFSDRRTHAVFTEFAVVGFVPWFRYTSVDALQLDALILNRDAKAMSNSDSTALARCSLPRFELLPFGADRADALPSDEQMLSFFIRWHVARKGRAPSGFFAAAMNIGGGGDGGGGGGGNPLLHDECDKQLANNTVRFFVRSTAASVLLANAACTMNLFHMWMRRDFEREQRQWMARQLTDALGYVVERHVVACSQAARMLFVDACVLPALRYFAPHVNARRLDATCVALDWFAFERSETTLHLDRFIEHQRPLTRDGERPATFAGGSRVVPLSTACRMFLHVYQTALEMLVEMPSIVVDGGDARTSAVEWRVDRTVMPLRGGDTYLRERTTEYDDFPLDGYVHRKLKLASNAVASTSTSFASPFDAALSAYNLPFENCMSESTPATATSADSSTSSSLSLHRSVSIPMRRSTSVISVSTEVLNDMCSSVALGDIEDVGTLVEPNSVARLYQRGALPLCARQQAAVYVETNDKYQSYEGRKFLFHFLTSLNIPGVDFDSISEFMLCNSQRNGMLKEHKRELDSLRKSSAKFVDGLREKWIASGMNADDATSRASCMGSCIGNAEKNRCPYAGTATEAGETRLRALLARTTPAMDADAVQRIVDAAKNSGGMQASRGCMQEFVETRRMMSDAGGGGGAPLGPDTLFTHPKHYVYASAVHATAAATVNTPTS